jgi:isoquinoline 1-oxidoreductase beta subunit
MNAPEQLARRRFLQLSGAAGGLLLFFGAGGEVAAAPAQPAVAALTAPLLNSWIRIAPDGGVALYSNISELGQGTGSALAQLIAEELEVPWQSIRIEMAPIAKAYFTTPDNYFTDSSRGVSAQFDSLRKVGATARMMLVQAASARWQADATGCHAEAGMVVHAASGRRLGYGEIAAEAAALPLPPADSVKLKPREAWRLIGGAPPRLDLPAKVDGSAVFGIDVTLPGMLMAAIAHCPVFGGTLGKLDEKPALAVRGVKKVVRLESAVAVVADSYWRAKKGLAALKPEWQVQVAQRGSAVMDAQLLASASSGKALVLGTDTVAEGEQAMQRFQAEAGQGARTLDAVYTVPYLAHATMEPMNGTAQVFADRAVLWLPTQAQLDSRNVAAEVLKLKPEQVTVHSTLCGGGFGRRDQVDFVLDAVHVARAMPGVPVKLIWSREEDMQHGYYRPACALRLQASVNADGLPRTLHFHSSGTIIPFQRPHLPWDARTLTGRAIVSAIMDVNPLSNVYGMGTMLLSAQDEALGVPVGYWRSVGGSQNGYALECFVDELAGQAGIDPLEYRRRMCQVPTDGVQIPPGMDAALVRKRIALERVVGLRVLDAAAKLAGWGKPLAPGHFHGMAFGKPSGTLVAVIAEVSVDKARRMTIHRLSCVADCGTAVNPHNIRAQIEGGLVFGLSAAMFGAITLKDGRVEQSNFHDYPLLQMAQTPRIDIQILETGTRTTGVGEAGVPMAAPALVNAIFAATGERVRALPLAKSGYTLV